MSDPISVPLLDLKPQYEALKPELDAAVAEVIASQYFILGPTVEGFEQATADYCQAEHAIGVSSGTDALIVAMMAMGIGEGDEVITSPYTFFGTVGSIVRLGATPVFVDIEPDSFNIDVSKIEAAITDKTRVIAPVHLFGQMADMRAINQIAREHDLLVIEDAAQAIGAKQHGRPACSFGHMGCLSFFPTKNLGGFGDGGMVVTDDAEYADITRQLRNHGMEPKYFHPRIGGNFRLDALQAAVLDVKLQHLNSWHEQRRENAALYRKLFAESGISRESRLTRQWRPKNGIILPTGESQQLSHLQSVRHLLDSADGTDAASAGQQRRLRDLLPARATRTRMLPPARLQTRRLPELRTRRRDEPGLADFPGSGTRADCPRSRSHRRILRCNVDDPCKPRACSTSPP